MALQAPVSSPIGGGGNAALRGRRRDFDNGGFVALKSSFFSFSPWIHRFMVPPTANSSVRVSASPRRISMRMASKSKQSSSSSYICRDCGYIYSDKTPFDKLADNYFCPVCGAPKRRFRAYEPDVSKNGNDKDVRKARKAQIQKDESIGKALPIAIAIGIVGLVALYFYLNASF